MEINDDIDMEIFVNGLSGIELPWDWKYHVLQDREKGTWLGWQYAHYFGQTRWTGGYSVAGGPEFRGRYEKFLEQENAK